MLKILAVSDTESRGLDGVITRSPEKLKAVDVIVSCGDIEKTYLEFLVDGINRDLFFVRGNHQSECPEKEDYADEGPVEKLLESLRAFPREIIRSIAGQNDLHGRVEVFRDYLIVGFGGSMWYSGRGNEHTEKEMARVVRAVEKKIQLYRLQEKIFKIPQREVIVVSHAPPFQVHDQPDVCHTGFKCFLDFAGRVAPALWLHGHTHLPDARQNQISVVGKTTVVNAFGFKFVTLDKKQIQVSVRSDILDKELF